MNEFSKDIAIVIPTSPSILNPDTSIIEKTINSVKKYLPNSSIVVTCDFFKPNIDITDDYLNNYQDFVNRLEQRNDIHIIVFKDHMHQSGMLSKIIDFILASQIFYLEHDWELTGEIPFEQMYALIKIESADLIRVLYPTELPPYYMDKMIDKTPQIVNGIPLVRTFQWSQNPHLASTEFYRKLLKENFKEDDKKFIEEGVIANVELEYRKNGWGKYKTFIYVPEGNTQRCIHLDGRGGGNI